MKLFLNNYVYLLLLPLITIIDASRIFCLPLLKIHQSNHGLRSLPILQRSMMKSYRERLIGSEQFIPLSAIELNTNGEQDRSESNCFICLYNNIELFYGLNILK